MMSFYFLCVFVPVLSFYMLLATYDVILPYVCLPTCDVILPMCLLPMVSFYLISSFPIFYIIICVFHVPLLVCLYGHCLYHIILPIPHISYV